MKLGPTIRAVEVYFALVILTVLGYALLKPASEFTYDITLLRIMVAVSSAARSIWLIERRASTARLFVIGSMAVVVILSALDMWLGGEFGRIASTMSTPLVMLNTGLFFGFSIFVMAYFAFSPRVREVFVVPLEKQKVAAEVGEPNGEEIYPKPFTWPWWRNLGIYYASFSIFGHWAEIGFCWLIVLGVFMGDYNFSHAQLWDWWLCPYPAEGLAMVFVVIALAPFKEWLTKRLEGRFWPTLALSFFANMIVCGAIDFLMGITTNADYQLWDYRGLPFNFMGQVLLQNTLVYSATATLIVWVIYPLLAKLLARAPQSVVNGLFVGLAGFYAFLEVLYYIHLGPTGLVFG